MNNNKQNDFEKAECNDLQFYLWVMGRVCSSFAIKKIFK